MSKSLFIVRTPFQLFNCMEAKSVYQDHGDAYLLCIYKKEIDRVLMENMIGKEAWKSVRFFRLNAWNRFFYPLILSGYLRQLKGAAYVFSGLVTPMISHCVNTVKAAKNVLLDDGNEILLIAGNIAARRYVRTPLQKIYNALLGRRVDYAYTDDLEIFTFFDLEKYRLRNRVIKNDYRAFKARIAAMPREAALFFIGSNLIGTYMDRSGFEAGIARVVAHSAPMKVVYVAHRYEDTQYLESLGARLGFEVVRFPVILEMALLAYGKIPERIATFRSTALETLGYLYEPIGMEVFEVDTDCLLKAAQVDEFRELYRHYRHKNIDLIPYEAQK